MANHWTYNVPLIYSQKWFLTLCLGIISCISGYAQNDSIGLTDTLYKGDKQVWELWEVSSKPEFDTHDNFVAFFASNLHVPENGIDSSWISRVQLKFIIDSTGFIDTSSVMIWPANLSKELEEEFTRIILLSNGKWKPAIHRGHPVNVQYILPVHLCLR